MKIKYLGTAAAEGIPGMFCECETCKKTWELGGKNIRTRSQALIDGKILIDFNADTYVHSLKYGFKLSKIDTILITHIHEDHYYPQDFGNRRVGFAHMDGCNQVRLIGSIDLNEPVLNDRVSLSDNTKPNRINVEYIKPYETIESQGYMITAIKAVHGTNNPLNYIISKDNSTMLYAHDTSEYDDETWNFIKSNFKHIDLISMDCTEGVVPMRYKGHMNIERDLGFMNKCKDLGFADNDTIFIANHFSHNGKATYDELVEFTKDMPIRISYDGLEVEF